MLIGDHQWKDCYSEPINCPSVHLIGETDGLSDFELKQNRNFFLIGKWEAYDELIERQCEFQVKTTF